MKEMVRFEDLDPSLFARFVDQLGGLALLNTLDLTNGQLAVAAWTSWTPTRTGWTDVGTAPVVTARYMQIGKLVWFQIKVVPGTTIATVAGTSYTSLPVACGASAIGGDGSMVNATSNVAVGNVVISVSNSRCYVPAQTASGDTFTISGWYEGA